MKQGALKFPIRTTSRDEAKAAGVRVKDGIRTALQLVKSNVRLGGSVGEMVTDFVKGRPASAEVALASIAAVIPHLSYETQVAFWQSLALSVADAPLHVLGGSVAHSWEQETALQAEADIAQQRGIRALDTGNEHDLVRAEMKSLAHAASSTELAMRFRASRIRVRSVVRA